jgi:hypothetical protein
MADTKSSKIVPMYTSILTSISYDKPWNSKQMIDGMSVSWSAAPQCYRFESRPGLRIISCADGGSFVLLRCPFVPKIIHERVFKVFLYQ